MTRTAVLRDPAITIGIGQFAAIQSVAPALGLEVTAIDSDIERAVTAFAGSPNGGIIVAASGLATANRELIIALRPNTNCLRSITGVASSRVAA